MEPWTPPEGCRRGGESPRAQVPPEITPGIGASVPPEDQAERDALADERDRLADDREALAEQRERDADDREQSMDELVRTLGSGEAELEQCAIEAFDRSRAVLAEQLQRLDRQEARAMRQRARGMRQHLAIARAAADRRDLPAAGSGDPMQEVTNLTQVARHALDVFTRTAKEIARRHDNAAVSSTGPGDEHRRAAERVREAVRRSAEIMREFPG